MNGILSHAIENTANQKARNLLHILRYATGSIPQKIPAFLAAYKVFYTFNEQYLFIYFNFFLSKLCTFKKRCQSVEYFSLIVFAAKALKSDVLC